MIKKITARDAPGSALPDLAAAVKDSSHPIWLAGLGAFAKAGAEGGKAFETLVKEGQRLHKKTRGVAEEHLGETATRLSEMLQGLSNGTSGPRDRFESLLEEGVARVLGRLGVPSAKELAALMQRIDAMEQQLASLTPIKPKAAESRTSGQAKVKPSKSSSSKSVKVPAKTPAPTGTRKAVSPKANRPRKATAPPSA